MLADGKLKEVCYLPDSHFCKIKIERKLLSCFEEIVGSDVIQDLKERGRYLEIVEGFDNISIIDEYKHISVMIPEVGINASCTELHEKRLSQLIEESKYCKELTIISSRLIIKESLVKSSIREVAQWITEKIFNILLTSKSDEISTFIVVGRLAKSRIIRKILRDDFKLVNIIYPSDDDELSVIKGAVLYGQGRADYS